MMAQENKNSLKDTIKFEKFDFNLWDTRYKNFEKVSDNKYSGYYKLKDGSYFRPCNGRACSSCLLYLPCNILNFNAYETAIKKNGSYTAHCLFSKLLYKSFYYILQQKRPYEEKKRMGKRRARNYPYPDDSHRKARILRQSKTVYN